MLSKTLRRFASSLPLVVTLAGCGAQQAQVAREPMAAAQAPAPAVLKESLYAKDSSGSLTEQDLQRVLASPIDLVFPARVGVVPLAEPFDAKGPVSIGTRSVAADRLSRALVGSTQFSHVSDISTDLPNSGGIEGLRVIAARYRLRYLILYSERFEDDTHANGWAWTYPTLIGMFITPGVTVESRGIAQADLLDVRTGTILFSVVQPMNVRSKQLMIGAARAHRKAQGEAAAKAAERLAKRVAVQANLLVAFADSAARGGATAATRFLPAPIASGTEGSVGVSVSAPPAP